MLRRPIYNANSPKLRLAGALGKAQTSTVNILCIGDSVTEGGQHSAFVNGRWVHVLQQNLQAQFGANRGGIGWLNCYSSIAYGTSTTYWSGSGSHSGTSHTRAFGGRYMVWAVNEVVTLTYVGTSFKVQYQLGTSDFTVNVDGSGAVNVSPGAGSTLQGAYSSPVLASGSHSAVFTPTSGQALKIFGAVIYDGDESAGVIAYENALYGNTTTSALSTYAGLTGLTDSMSANFCYNPSLVTIMFGLNDDNGGMSTATYTANLQTIISNVKSFCTNNPTFLVCGQWDAGSYSTHGLLFDAAAEAVATADPENVIYNSYYSTITSGAGTIYTDSIHPNDAGHTAIGNQMSAFLAPTVSFSDTGTRPHPFQPGSAR